MTTVDKFLCCFELRTGALIIGIIYSFGSLLIVSTCILVVVSGTDYVQVILDIISDENVKQNLSEQKWGDY